MCFDESNHFAFLKQLQRSGLTILFGWCNMKNRRQETGDSLQQLTIL